MQCACSNFTGEKLICENRYLCKMELIKNNALAGEKSSQLIIINTFNFHSYFTLRIIDVWRLEEEKQTGWIKKLRRT